MGKEISWAVKPTVDMLQAQSDRIKARKHFDHPAGCPCLSALPKKHKEQDG